LGLVDYLRLSWDPSTRPKTLELEPNVRWLGLRIVEHVQMDADHAEVEFIARYRSGGGAATRLHERSRFVRHLEGWRYVDGQQRE
jgi:SEC-C motif-containing protein